MQPSSPGNRHIDARSSHRKHHEQCTKAVKGTQALRCMANHAHGIALCNGFEQGKEEPTAHLLANCAATLLACSGVHVVVPH